MCEEQEGRRVKRKGECACVCEREGERGNVKVGRERESVKD